MNKIEANENNLDETETSSQTGEAQLPWKKLNVPTELSVTRCIYLAPNGQLFHSLNEIKMFLILMTGIKHGLEEFLQNLVCLETYKFQEGGDLLELQENTHTTFKMLMKSHRKYVSNRRCSVTKEVTKEETSQYFQADSDTHKDVESAEVTVKCDTVENSLSQNQPKEQQLSGCQQNMDNMNREEMDEMTSQNCCLDYTMIHDNEVSDVYCTIECGTSDHNACREKRECKSESIMDDTENNIEMDNTDNIKLVVEQTFFLKSEHDHSSGDKFGLLGEAFANIEDCNTVRREEAESCTADTETLTIEELTGTTGTETLTIEELTGTSDTELTGSALEEAKNTEVNSLCCKPEHDVINSSKFENVTFKHRENVYLDHEKKHSENESFENKIAPTFVSENSVALISTVNKDVCQHYAAAEISGCIAEESMFEEKFVKTNSIVELKQHSPNVSSKHHRVHFKYTKIPKVINFYFQNRKLSSQIADIAVVKNLNCDDNAKQLNVNLGWKFKYCKFNTDAGKKRVKMKKNKLKIKNKLTKKPVEYLKKKKKKTLRISKLANLNLASKLTNPTVNISKLEFAKLKIKKRKLKKCSQLETTKNKKSCELSNVTDSKKTLKVELSEFKMTPSSLVQNPVSCIGEEERKRKIIQSPYFNVQFSHWNDKGSAKRIKSGSRGAHETFNYVPPKSPHKLIQEQLYENPWQMLIATIFLNRTTGKAAIPIFWQFLKKYPSPQKVLRGNVKDIAELMKPLGLNEKRAYNIWKFSNEYLNKDWKYPIELHGIGYYGDNSYRMFCLGQWKSVKPNDYKLVLYQEWINEQDGLGLL